MSSATNSIADRVFSPVSRDWERSSALLRIMLESLTVVGVALLLAHWLSPDDPFGIEAQFPWIWLAPMLLAMRYGTIDGVLATALLLAAWLLPAPWGMTGIANSSGFPQQYFLGGLLQVLLAGQFADAWNGRLSRVRAANAYLEERLTSLTRAHYLLRLSHQRLEHELLVRPVTLSDLILELRPNTPVDIGQLEKAENLLRMLAGSCDVEAGAIHAIREGRLDPQPAATFGEIQALAPGDPLITMALDAGRLVHVRASDATLYHSRYLVACPLTASAGEAIGMLLVRSMPFYALNEENLQFMAVLSGYFADGLMRASAIHPVRLLRPNVPPDFALELVRMKRLHDTAQVDSTLLALGFAQGDEGRQAFEHVRRTRRSTDICWELETARHNVMLMLLPMSGPEDVEGLLMRMEASLRQQMNKGFAELSMFVKSAGVSAAEPEWLLDDMLNRCGLRADITLPALSGEPAS
ncbi:MAG: PelD GGDEF domain-containing protein [Burkholderiaceae bacterium]